MILILYSRLARKPRLAYTEAHVENGLSILLNKWIIEEDIRHLSVESPSRYTFACFVKSKK